MIEVGHADLVCFTPKVADVNDAERCRFIRGNSPALFFLCAVGPQNGLSCESFISVLN